MKKGKLAGRLLTIILSAAMVVSSVDCSMLTVTANAEEVTLDAVDATPETQADVTEDASKEDSPADGDAENTADDTTAESVSENDIDTKDDDQDDGDSEDGIKDLSGFDSSDSEEEDSKDSQDTEDEETKDEQDEDISEVDESLTAEMAVDGDTLVTYIMTDANLQKALVNIYNKQAGKSVGVSSFTVAQLRAITSIDLTNKTITGVDPASIKSVDGIGYATGATEIDISTTGITGIEEGVFENNSNKGNLALQTIVLNDTLATIGKNAFSGCKNLAHVYVRANGTKNTTANNLPSGLKNAGSGIFQNCTELASMNINCTTGTAIQTATDMFSGCTNLETIGIGANITALPDAFASGASGGTKENPKALTVSIATGSKLGTIGAGAFRKAAMESLDLSKCTSLTKIDSYAFSRVSGISGEDKTPAAKYVKTLILPANTSGLTLGDGVFYDTPVEKVYPSGTSVNSGDIILPDYVTEIGRGAFYCADKTTPAMKTLKLSAKLKSIPGFAFYGNRNLTTVTTSVVASNNAITTIGDCAFKNTENLTSAAFLGKMNHLQKIGSNDLEDNQAGAHTMVFADYMNQAPQTKKMSSDVFYNSAIKTVELPASLRFIASGAFDTSKRELTTVKWNSETTPAAAQEYKICSAAFVNNDKLTSFTYPKTATDAKTSFVIEAGAFKGCAALVDFLQTGTSNDSGHTKNSLPVALTKLGTETFSDCTSLPSMAISNNTKNECPSLGNKAFKNCTKMTSALLPLAIEVVPEQFYYNAPIKTFPATGTKLTKISAGAFFGNGMTNVDLSKHTGLTNIDTNAFSFIDLTGRDPVYANIINGGIVPAPLTSVNLPKVTGKFTFGDYVFQAAKKFTTLKVAGAGSDGKVYMPDFIPNTGIGVNLFAGTGVTDVDWQFESTGNNPWDTIREGMFNAAAVSNISRVVFKNPATLKKIAGNAFYGCEGLTEIDLSIYPNLEKVTGTSNDGAFANCINVRTIKLPNNGKYTKVEDNTFRVGAFGTLKVVGSTFKSELTTIDFGGVTEIGNGAFACYTSTAVGSIKTTDKYLSALTKLDFTNTKVTKIGDSAFQGHYAKLKTVNFTNIQSIGKSAFENCAALVMTGMPMADSVQTIGASAFKGGESIGQVVLGAGLTQLGASAFENCSKRTLDSKGSPTAMTANTGLTAIDFTKATKLATIGGNAFAHTALKDFDLGNVPVQILPKGMLSNCPYLQSISLGNNVKLVNGDVANGCTSLSQVSFASTTTMEKAAFQTQGSYKTTNNGYTPIENVTFKLYPVDLSIAKGRVTKFPYYVTKYDTTTDMRLGSIIIGTPDAAAKPSDYNPADVYRFVKVNAYTSDYYVKQIKDSNRIQKVAPSNYSNYYVPVTDYSTMKYKTEAGVDVITFDLYGLEATPAGKSIPFTITNSFAFKSGTTDVSRTISVDYRLQVSDIPYRAELYTNKDRTTTEEGMKYDATTGKSTLTRTVRASKTNPSGMVTYYYDIKNVKNTTTRPDNCNLVIKSSNPDVMVAATSRDVALVTGTKDTWKMSAKPYDLTVANSWKATEGKVLSLKPLKSGDVTITIYPEGCPAQTTTLTYHVTADISDVRMAIPREYAAGFHAGDQFNILDSVNMYLNQSVSKTKENLNQLSSLTDNTITFTSSHPNLVSVDAAGNVKVLAVSKESTVVTIKAIVTVPGGEGIERELNRGISYPPLRSGAELKDSTGAAVKVTSIPGRGVTTGTVTYVKPAKGAKSVTIPATVKVDGVACKVTAIEKDAFKNCKTLTTVNIKAKIKDLPENAFYGCVKLKSVTLPTTVTSIGKNAFKNCKVLTKIVIPKKVTTIEEGAFMGCVKLKTVTINAKGALINIGKNAFSGCKVLTKITIPNKVKTIGAGAFNKCAKLKAITVKSTAVTMVGKNAFKGIAKSAVIKVPSKKLADYKNLFAKKGQAGSVKIK